MTDEIRHEIRVRDDVREDIKVARDLRDEPDAEFSTADLAEVNRKQPRTLDVKPLLNKPLREGESTQDGPAGVPLVSDTGRPVAPAAAASGPATAAGPARALEQETGPLFSSDEANQLRSQWDAVQVSFVDEPRRAVQQADNLVAGTMKRLAEIFADERRKLEGQWEQGENVSTEDLRLALRKYRSFFSRLLSV